MVCARLMGDGVVGDRVVGDGLMGDGVVRSRVVHGMLACKHPIMIHMGGTLSLDLFSDLRHALHPVLGCNTHLKSR